jgi:hypothetical protein
MRRFHSYGPVDGRYHFCVERHALVEQCLNQLVGIPEESAKISRLPAVPEWAT